VDKLTELECEYCGKPQGDRLTCCSEQHWVPVFDWRKEDREWEGITATIDGGISERGSDRWREVMDEESGPDVDESDETTEES
jgi:hypothetical protein